MLFTSSLSSKMKDKYIDRSKVDHSTFLHPFHTTPPPNPNPNHHSAPPFHPQKRECLSDEPEVDSTIPNKTRRSSGGGGDGATIEVVKRPRGRPPGSKNKPKPPVMVTRDAPEQAAVMRPHVLEIPNGHDVVDSLVRFSTRRNLGVCVLAGTGAVSNVTLHQPGAAAAGGAAGGSSIVFHGRFEILSISATFLPPAIAAVSPPAANGTMSISLAGPHGQIVGGTVAGPVVTAGTVIMVVAAFNNPTFHRLPVEDDVSVSVSVSGGGTEEIDNNRERVDRKRHVQRRVEAYPMEEQELPQREQEQSMYSCHLPSDVIWAPAPRPPPY